LNDRDGRNSFTVLKANDVTISEVVEQVHDQLLEDLDVRVLQQLPEHEARRHVERRSGRS